MTTNDTSPPHSLPPYKARIRSRPERLLGGSGHYGASGPKSNVGEGPSTQEMPLLVIVQMAGASRNTASREPTKFFHSCPSKPARKRIPPRTSFVPGRFVSKLAIVPAFFGPFLSFAQYHSPFLASQVCQVLHSICPLTAGSKISVLSATRSPSVSTSRAT